MKSTKKSQRYSAEFRESAVKFAVENSQPKAVTARELGINVNTLHTWIDKYHRANPISLQLDDKHLYDQLKELRKENLKLKEERDILKKAAAYFASHQA